MTPTVQVMANRQGESVWTRGLIPRQVAPLVSIALVLPLMGGVLTFTGSASYWPAWGLPVLWTVAVAVIVLVFVVGISTARAEKARYTQVGGPVLSWQAAENMAAAHMRAYGFSDARTTPGGSDGGIDVVSRWGVAQVKYFSNPVGRPDVQKLRGAAHGRDRVLFYALSGVQPERDPVRGRGRDRVVPVRPASDGLAGERAREGVSQARDG